MKLTEDFTGQHLTPVLTMQCSNIRLRHFFHVCHLHLFFFPHETQWSDCSNKPQNIRIQKWNHSSWQNGRFSWKVVINFIIQSTYFIWQSMDLTFFYLHLFKMTRDWWKFGITKTFECKYLSSAIFFFYTHMGDCVLLW